VRFNINRNLSFEIKPPTAEVRLSAAEDCPWQGLLLIQWGIRPKNIPIKNKNYL